MKDINDLAFIIAGRVKSSRIPNKMLKDFNGTNLFELGINKILSSKVIPNKNIYIAVGDDELITIANKYIKTNSEINLFKRSRDSVDCDGSDIVLACEWCHVLKKKYKYYCWLNLCQPFISIDTIDNLLTTFINSPNKSIITVNKTKNYFWDNDMSLNIDKYKTSEIFSFNTKYVPFTYSASHTIFAGKLDELSNGIWLGTMKKNDPELFVIEENETFDIDYPWEFDMALGYYKLLNNT